MRMGGIGRAIAACAILLTVANEASAWQRPKAEPAAKAEACPEMGEGFVRIPGSATCIRVGGSVRVEALHVGGSTGFSASGR